MQDVPAFIEAKNRLWGKAFILLLEIEYTPGSFWRIAQLGKAETSIIFEGQTWDAFGIGPIRRSQNSRAEIPAFDIPIANPERIFQSILHNYVIEGSAGRLVTVHRDHMDDPTAKIEEWFTIKMASSNAKVITLMCEGVRFNPRRSRIPSRTMTRAEYPGLLGSNRRRFF